MEQQKEQVRAFLQAYEEQFRGSSNLEGASRTTDGTTGSGAQLPSLPSQETTPQQQPQQTPEMPQQQVQVAPQQPQPVEEAPAEVEETSEWWQGINVDELLAETDDLAFLANPKQVLSNIVSKIDQHYKQQIQAAFTPLVQELMMLRAQAAEMEFFMRHPDLLQHKELTYKVAEELLREADKISSLSQEQVEALIVQRVRERLQAVEAPPAGVVRSPRPQQPTPVDPTRNKVRETLEALGFKA